jgi:protein-S-isoprenylcysteine O-methyltransferase Ste14
MVKNDHKKLGEEHPKSDPVQIFLFILLLCVWILDSFLLKYYTISMVPLLIRIIVSIILTGVGIYYIYKSHTLIFHDGEPILVDWGVYSVSRHPMYLGSLLFELGIVSTTLSIPAFIVFLIIFGAYDRFALYEEVSLIEVLGEDYRDYMKKVKRWGLF